MTRSSLLALLVLTACASAAPKAAPASTAAAAPAAASTGEPAACCDGACADEPTPTATTAASTAHEFKRVTPSADYPLNACLITGEELGAVADRVAFSYDGTEVQFCCPGCAKKFEKNPAPYLAKVAAAKAK